MPPIHIMVDLETFGVTPGSVVASIGAVVFDPIEGTVGERFYGVIDRASAEAAGLVADAKTLEWWSQQSAEAQAALTDNPSPLTQVLQVFARWWTEQVGDSEGRFWCQGPSFDLSLLEAAYRLIGERTPWKYNAGRDTRTIYELSGILPDLTTGAHHNALDDAERQALAIIAGFKKIGQPQRSYDDLAAAYHAKSITEAPPSGTREELGGAAAMLEAWAPDTFPANERGQVHFARAMMDSVASTIRAFLNRSEAEAA